jgi:hypothetical protein
MNHFVAGIPASPGPPDGRHKNLNGDHREPQPEGDIPTTKWSPPA